MSQKIKLAKGDGELLHRAIRESRMKVDEILKAMRIANGTLYKLYKREILDDDTKAAAAQALGKSISEIFSNEELENALKLASGNRSIKVEDLGTEINNKNETKKSLTNNNIEGSHLHSPSSIKEEDKEDMLYSLIRAQQDYAQAAKDTARANLILTEMLQQRGREDDIEKTSSGTKIQAK